MTPLQRQMPPLLESPFREVLAAWACLSKAGYQSERLVAGVRWTPLGAAVYIGLRTPKGVAVHDVAGMVLEGAFDQAALNGQLVAAGDAWNKLDEGERDILVAGAVIRSHLVPLLAWAAAVDRATRRMVEAEQKRARKAAKRVQKAVACD